MDCGATIKMEPDAEEPVTMNAVKCEPQNHCNFAFVMQSDVKVASVLKCDPELQIQGIVDKEASAKRSTTSCTSLDSKDAKLYTCDLCERSFTLRHNFKSHLDCHSNKRPFKCSICSKCFKRKFTLQVHVKTHLNLKRNFKCPMCPKSFKRKGTLEIHEKTHSSEYAFKCNVCSKGYHYHTSLQIHLKTHSEDKPFECDVCAKSFKLKFYLKCHLKTHSIIRPYHCDYCPKTFRNKHMCKLHMCIQHKSDLVAKSHQCDICFKTFFLTTHLRDHLTTHSDERPFQCDFCSKSFKRKCVLVRHLQIHSDTRRLKRSAKTANVRNRSVRHAKHEKQPNENQGSEHTNKLIKPSNVKLEAVYHPLIKTEPELIADHSNLNSYNRFHCDVCSKCFKRKTALLKHFKTHSDTQLFKCEPEQSDSKMDLLNHLIHTKIKEKSIPTLVAEQTCKSKHEPIKPVYIKTETGYQPSIKNEPELIIIDDPEQDCPNKNVSNELNVPKVKVEEVKVCDKPRSIPNSYKCDICFKTFEQMYRLRSHMIVHLEARPFKCDICTKGFKTKYLLGVHLKTHSGERPFCCNFCFKTFRNNYRLRVHLKSAHGVEGARKYKKSDKVIKLHECTICLKTFTLNSHLKDHIVTHSDERPFKCNLCPKSFKRKCILVKHFETHSKSRPSKRTHCSQPIRLVAIKPKDEFVKPINIRMHSIIKKEPELDIE